MNSWLSSKDLVLIAASYALGCIATGYYLIRARTGEDIRHLGSGAVGARNVGRRLGGWGFNVTFLLDVLKGALAVGVARYFQLSEWGLVLAVMAVVLGHVWPVQLRFQGGKGLSPALGALLVYDYSIVVVQISCFLAVYAVTRSSLLGVMLGYVLTPLGSLVIGQSGRNVAMLSVLAALVVFTHRANLRDEIIRQRARRKLAKSPP